MPPRNQARKGIRLATATASVCLAASSAAWAAAGEAPSRFAIPKLAAPPTLDGTIDETEWRGALRLDGVTPVGGPGPVDARETTFWIGWDEGHIYIAGRSELRANERLATNWRIIDTQQVVYDDSYEIGFDTLGRSEKPGEEPFCYKLFINFYDRMGLMKSIPSIGGFQYTWNPQFTRKSRITSDRKFWEFEMAMPMGELEQEAPNRPGDEIRLLLGRNYKYPWQQQAVPLMKSGYFDSSGWPLATLVADTPYVHLLDLQRIPHENKAVARVRVLNPGATPAAVTVTTTWSGGLETRETLTIPAGGEAIHLVDRELAEPKGQVDIRATTGDGTILLDTRLGYSQDSAVPPYEGKVYQPGDLPLSVEFNPMRSQIWLQGDTLDIEWLTDADRLTWQVEAADGRQIAAGEIAAQNLDMYAGLIELPALASGEYRVSARVLDAAGKQLAAGETTLVKKDEPKAFAWLDNKLGNPERVIPPFAALALRRPSSPTEQTDPTSPTGPTLSCWGREFTLSGLGLPVSMRSQDGELLAAPARLVVVRNGQEFVVPVYGTPEVTEVTDWRIRFRGKAEGAGLRFTVEGQLEQDGSLFYDLTYAPLDGRPITLDALRLEYPIRDAEATLIHSVGSGGNYATKSSDFVPAGEGKLWDTFGLGRQASGMTVGTFYPQVWLGNDLRGFLWWADNDCGWVPDDDIAAHEVFRQGDQVVLRNNIVGKPFELAAARTIRFVLNATPFKPLRPGWRLFTDHSLGRFSGQGFKEEGRIKGWNLLHAPSKNREEWSAIYARYGAEAERRMRERLAWNADLYGQGILASGVPIFGYGHRTLEQDVLDYFDADWQDSLSPSQQDYYLSLIDQWIREGGLKRQYFDITFPRLLASVLNGTAYLLPDGRIQPGFTLEAMRCFYLRVFALFHDHGHMPNGLTGHSTNNYPLPILAWMEILLDGEYNHVKDSSPFEWIDGVTPGRIRAMNTPANWGLPFAWLIKLQIQNNPDEQARQMDSARGWLRLHDNWESVRPYAYWAWGLGRADVVHTPYWRAAGIAEANNPNLRVSLWQHADGVLALIYNDHKTKAVDGVAVQLDLAKLGLDKLAASEKLVFEIIEGKTDGPPVFDGLGNIANFGLQARKWTAVSIDRVRTRSELPVPSAAALAGIDPDRLWRWGLARDDVRPGEALVQLADEALALQTWQRPNRLLLLVRNPTPETRAVQATLDMEAAGFLPINPIHNRIGWQILGHAGVVEDRRAGPLAFDPVEGTVTTRLEPAGWMAIEFERH